jgi:hypothetical protein
VALIHLSSGSQTFIYSTTPNAASQLFRSSDYFYTKQSPRCDDLIRAIKAGGELEPAIRVLIDAAGYEWDRKKQTQLLTGAAFGKVRNFFSGLSSSSLLSPSFALRSLPLPLPCLSLSRSAYEYSDNFQSFLDGVQVPTFEATGRIIRVLNAVRDPEVGIPISVAQFQILTPELVINRLLGRNLHSLAFKICSYLGISSVSVLVHWATRKVI